MGKKRVRQLVLIIMMAVMIFTTSGNVFAASPKLSATKLTITKGQSQTLTITNVGKKKVVWKTSDKKVVTIRKISNTKVTLVSGSKTGTATITAKVGKKSYKCKVTVKKEVKKVNKGPALTVETYIAQNNGSTKTISATIQAGKTGKLEIKNSARGTFQQMYITVGGRIVADDASYRSSNPKVLSYSGVYKQFIAFTSMTDGTTDLQITYKGYTYHVQVKISDTSSSYYSRKRKQIYQQLGITSAMKKQYVCYLLATWICEHASYDDSGNQPLIGINASYKDFFRSGKIICSGYADLYSYLCQGMGITNRQVVSSSMNHRWNQVQIDGKWYNVDVCWMDTGKKNQYYFEYFMVSDYCLEQYSDGQHYASDFYSALDRRFDACCTQQRKLQNAKYFGGQNVPYLYSQSSDLSPWMSGTWKNY